MKYRPEIDGLRAIAVVPVVLHHAGFSAFAGGFVGVDVFFVISGYLITSLILQDIEAGQFSIVSFYERRARRILPALVAVVLVSFPFAYLCLYPREFKDFGESVLSVALFYSNMHFMSETDYFGSAAALKPLIHTWSLAVEEQFYLIYPLLMVFLMRRGSHFTTKIILLLSIVSLALAEFGWRYFSNENYFLYPTRAWELGIGCLLSMTLIELQTRGEKYAQVLSVLGLLMILTAIFMFDENTPFPSVYALVPVIGAALLIVFATPHTFTGRLLSTPVCVGLGLISYSWYLWHQPVFAFAKLRFGYEEGAPIFLFLALLSLVFGYVSWRYVETPFRNRAKINRDTIFKYSMFSGALLIVLGIGAIASVQFGIPKNTRLNDIANRLRPNFGIAQSCDYRGQFKVMDQCQSGPKPTLALWGDSYAMQLFEGLRAADPSTDIVQIARSSCGSINGLSVVNGWIRKAKALECLQFNEKALQYLITNKDIKDVVLASRYDSFLSDDTKLIGKDGELSPEEAVVERHLLSTIDALKAAGKRVTVVSSAPRTGTDIGRCLGRALRFGDDLTTCDFSYQDYVSIEKNLYRERDFLAKIAAKNINTIMLEDFVCNKNQCKASNGDTLMYKDDGHLSIEGSKWLGQNTQAFRAIFAPLE